MLQAKILNLRTDEFREIILSPELNPCGECIIGRHPNCDLILDSPEVSDFHAKIVCHSGEYLLSDLNSTQGCRLNNYSLQLNENYILEREDALYIGNFLFLIQEIE
ncbi:MAG TPA: FHA domain-containing protein [Coleofasciculaceae cyanobacterium]